MSRVKICGQRRGAGWGGGVEFGGAGPWAGEAKVDTAMMALRAGTEGLEARGLQVKNATLELMLAAASLRCLLGHASFRLTRSRRHR